MLKNVAIPVHHDTAFPFGAALITKPEPVYSFEQGKRGEQQVDKDTGMPVYEVTVVDNDEEVRGAAKTMKVKIFSAVQPIAPPSIPGMPAGYYFAPVEFDGLTAKPYVQEYMEGRHRVAWSLTARGLRAPSAGSNGTAKSGKEAVTTA